MTLYIPNGHNICINIFNCKTLIGEKKEKKMCHLATLVLLTFVFLFRTGGTSSRRRYWRMSGVVEWLFAYRVRVSNLAIKEH
jgi:hypothetical protein